METWAIVTLVLGTSAISSLLTFVITKMQVSHSDRRFEKEHERAIVMYQRNRRREVRSEPLLKLRDELARMAVKQDRVVRSAHKLHTRFGMTEEEAKEELQRNIEEVNKYIESGEFYQTLFMQYDKELIDKVEEIIRDYRASFFDAINFKELKHTEIGKAMEVFERNKDKIIEVQELINKRLEEL